MTTQNLNYLLYVLLLVCSACPINAAEQGYGINSWVKFPGGKTYLFRLTLADKNGTPYSLQSPQDFLSQKAIDRRKRQGLSVDSTDLPLPPAYLNRISSTAGVEVLCVSKWNKTVLVRVKDPSKIKPLVALPFVVKSQKVFTSPDSIKKSDRSLYHEDLEKWDGDIDDEYGMSAQNIDLINGRMLHRWGFRGKGMTIAVFDGGFMNVDRIPAMHGIRIAGTRDFVAFKSHSIYEEHDHGTKVLSTMAVNQPGVFVGTAPDATYWLIRAEDTSTESLAEEDYWAASAEFADSVGVDIISSSLGFQDFDDKTTDHQYSELDGRPKRKNATFSSVGPSEDGRVKPDIMALGSPASVISGRGAANSDMGTSFAAPTISGMVACLWQSVPKATAFEVMDAIRRSGDNYSTPNNVFGYGIPDFEKAGGRAGDRSGLSALRRRPRRGKDLRYHPGKTSGNDRLHDGLLSRQSPSEQPGTAGAYQ